MKRLFFIIAFLFITGFCFAEDYLEESLEKYSKIIEDFYNKGTYVVVYYEVERFNYKTGDLDIVRGCNYIRKASIDSITFEENNTFYIDESEFYLETDHITADKNCNIIIESTLKLKD